MALVKVRMRQTVLYGPDRARLEQGREYELPADAVQRLVPRYAEVVGSSASDDGAAGGAAASDVDLASMTVAELRALASERGVELGEARRKADIIAVLRGG